MPQILLYIIATLGVLILLYYIFMILAGKRFARLVRSKDRFIWNGLRNVSDPSLPYAKKINTLFLDQENLVVSPDSIVRMSGQIRKSGTLEDALVIPFERIISFDFDSALKDSFIVFRFFAFLFNRLFKVNNYDLTLGFIDEKDEVSEMKFRARNMDARDFELAFADFDHRIYSGKTLTAHERRKKRPARRMRDDVEPIAGEQPEFSLADEEVSVLEQTIYLPQEEWTEPQADEDELPPPVATSDQTVRLSTEELEEEFVRTDAPKQTPQLELFSVAEDDMEQTVSMPKEEPDTRAKMRAFMKNRRQDD